MKTKPLEYDSMALYQWEEIGPDVLPEKDDLRDYPCLVKLMPRLDADWWRYGQRFSIPETVLRQANPHLSTLIIGGDDLFIPVSAEALENGALMMIVPQGASLSYISQVTGVSTQTLAGFNSPASPDFILAGAELAIPIQSISDNDLREEDIKRPIAVIQKLSSEASPLKKTPRRSSSPINLLHSKRRVWKKYGMESVMMGLNIWGFGMISFSKIPNLGKALIGLELSLIDSPEALNDINLDHLEALADNPEVTGVTTVVILLLGLILIRKNPQKAEVIFSAIFSFFVGKAHMERVATENYSNMVDRALLNENLSEEERKFLEEQRATIQRELGAYLGDFLFFSFFATIGVAGQRYIQNESLGALFCVPDDVAPGVVDYCEQHKGELGE